METGKTGRPSWFIPLVASALVAAVLALWVLSQPTTGEPPISGGSPTPFPSANASTSPEMYNPYYSGLQSIVDAELNGTQSNATRGDYLPAAMFSELPAFPADIYRMHVLFKYYQMGKLRNQTNITAKELGPEYWSQPEWVPTFFTNGLDIMQDPPVDTYYYSDAEYELISANQMRNKNTGELTTFNPGVIATILPNQTIEVKVPRFGVEGYIIYPSDLVIIDAHPDTIFDVYAVLYTGWYVQSYQGVNLNATFPESGGIENFQIFPDGTKLVNQTPSIVQNYFSVEFEPDQFVLEPSFPIFKRDWARLVRMRITVNENTPPGKYIVGMDIVPPSSEFSDDMLWRYGPSYRVGGIGIGRPFFRVFVQVV